MIFGEFKNIMKKVKRFFLEKRIVDRVYLKFI